MIVLSTTTPSEGLQLASLLGYAGFFFLAASVLLGIAKAIDRPNARIGGQAIEQLHLTCAVAGVTALAGHIAAHITREQGGMTFVESLMPFLEGGWIVGVGVLSWLLLIVVLVATPVRQQLGYRGWLIVHRLSYLAALLMAIHVVAAADEIGNLELGGIAVLAVIVWVLFGVRDRLRSNDHFSHRPEPRPQQEPPA